MTVTLSVLVKCDSDVEGSSKVTVTWRVLLKSDGDIEAFTKK